MIKMTEQVEARLHSRTASYKVGTPLKLWWDELDNDVPCESSFDGFIASINKDLLELESVGWECDGVAFPPTDVRGDEWGELRYVFVLNRLKTAAEIGEIEDLVLARWDDMPAGPVRDGVTAFLSPNLHDREASPCVMSWTPAFGGRWVSAEESTKTWLVRRTNGGRALYVLNREFDAWAIYPCEGLASVAVRSAIRETFEEAVEYAETRWVTG